MPQKSSTQLLVGEKVHLRPLQPQDLELIYLWENDPATWQYGDCGYEPNHDITTDNKQVTTPTQSNTSPTTYTKDSSTSYINTSSTTCTNTSSTTYTKDSGSNNSNTSDNNNGNTSATPPERFSREEIRQFIENQQHDIRETGQIRFVICRRNTLNTKAIENSNLANPTTPEIPIGLIDLFDLDPKNLSAGVGILIYNKTHRRQGYASEALTLISNYARQTLGLRELRSTVAADNTASLALFTAANFTRTTSHIAPPKNTTPHTKSAAEKRNEITFTKMLYD
ncbi:MAG: GNAT family N-acetyltransferase [Alistipes sp.]|jgi:RimJ/RimL family protein N-acetyltransferase|nr:GNAT family N-acetyltransferase [Alistipes sp.]